MIARLRGTLIERGADFVVVECGGVGYRAHASATTLFALPNVGDPVTLRVHTHFAQEKFSLYAFGTSEEQALFHQLITVEKVGPGAALIILGGGSPQVIARMIAAGDEGGLSTIKGIGKKTAEKIVFKLQEPCELLLATWGAGGVSEGVPARGPIARPPILNEVAGALVSLGYKQAIADKAVSELPITEEATVESLLRDALKSMPR